MKENSILKEISYMLKDVLCVILSLIIYIFIQGLSAGILVNNFKFSSTTANIAGSILCIVVLFPLFYLPVKKKLIENELRLELKINKKSLVWVIIAGVSSCMLLNTLVMLTQINNIVISYDSVAEVLYGADILPVCVQMIIVAPLIEELLFRGIIYQRFKSAFAYVAHSAGLKKYPQIMAALFSAAIFGFLHGNLLQGIYAFLLGMILAFIMEKYQSLLPCILFHMSANLISVLGTKTGLLMFIFTSKSSLIIYSTISGLLLVISLVKLAIGRCAE